MVGECEVGKKLAKGKASDLDGMLVEVYKAIMKAKWLRPNQSVVCVLV